MAFVPQKTIALRPMPTLASSDCNSIDGIPLLPSSSSYQCGTKTTNRTLINTCCNGLEVDTYLGCFMYCSIGSEMNLDRMREMVNCLSSNGTTTTSAANGDSIDENVFCQGNLTANVQVSASSMTRRSPFSGLLLTTILMLSFFTSAIQAQDCTFSIESGSEVIKQGEPRSTVGAGIGCRASQDFCLVSMSGTAEIIGANRTINGEDASSPDYDSFFEILGETTDPQRLFSSSTSFMIDHWGVGLNGFSNFPYWAPFSYCVNGTASNCDEVDGYVEACGALFQTAGGPEDTLVPQGIFLNDIRAF